MRITLNLGKKITLAILTICIVSPTRRPLQATTWRPAASNLERKPTN